MAKKIQETEKEDRTYILLYRKLIQNPVFKNAQLLQLWIYCLLKANYSANEFIFNDELIKLKRGQFVTGRKVIAKDLNQNENSIYKRLNILKKLGYLNIKSNNRFSILTIVKYDSYQTANPKSNSQSNNNVTTEEQQGNTNNKEVKKKKESVHTFEDFKNYFIDESDYLKYKDYDLSFYFDRVKNTYPDKSFDLKKMKSQIIFFIENDIKSDKFEPKKNPKEKTDFVGTAYKYVKENMDFINQLENKEPIEVTAELMKNYKGLEKNNPLFEGYIEMAYKNLMLKAV